LWVLGARVALVLFLFVASLTSRAAVREGGAIGLWEKDVAGKKVKADKFWPRLVEVKAGQKNPVDSLLGNSVLAEIR
jgi:hypothetical protein